MAFVETFSLVGPLEKRPTSVQFSTELSELAPVDNSAPNDRCYRTADAHVQVQDNLPISEIQVNVDSWRMPSFLDDYYYRVHVIPGSIDLGNLLSSQVRQVEVWSAHFEPQLLSSLTVTDADGITLSQPKVPPTYFAALESRTYSLSVSTNGSPVINAEYVFSFPSEKPSLSVFGRRVAIWPFIPQTKHKETLEWKTDIMPSFNVEQRMAMRLAPRQSFSHDFHLDPYQFSRAKAIATQWSHRTYGLPVWSELAHVGDISAGATEILLDTTVSDFRNNDIVVIWESDTKVVAVEITEVANDRVTLKLPLTTNCTNAYVAPMRFATTPEGVTFSRGTGEQVQASVTFQVKNNVDLGASVGYPTYRDRDVLTERTLVVGDLSERISRSMDFFDNGSGPIEQDVTTGWVSSRKAITFSPLTRSERWRVRRWLHRIRGRQGSFWLPSWNRDIELLEDIGSTASAITVKYFGYTLYYGVTNIMVQLKSGAKYFARVLSSSNAVADKEVLVLEAPIGVTITVPEVDMICFLSHCRLDADRIEISHEYNGQITTNIAVTETPE
jgi:hypothetical protein